MSFGLFDYAQQNPDIEEPQQEARAIRDTSQMYREKQDQRQEVTRLKESILQQLEEGNAPQLILYTALKAIGAATADAEWTEAATGHLDAIYGDLMQESLLTDNAAIASKRLNEKREDYINKTRRKLKRIENETGTIYGLVQTLQDHLTALENETDIITAGEAIYKGGGIAKLHNQYLNKKAKEKNRQQADKTP